MPEAAREVLIAIGRGVRHGMGWKKLLCLEAPWFLSNHSEGAMVLCRGGELIRLGYALQSVCDLDACDFWKKLVSL